MFQVQALFQRDTFGVPRAGGVGMNPIHREQGGPRHKGPRRSGPRHSGPKHSSPRHSGPRHNRSAFPEGNLVRRVAANAFVHGACAYRQICRRHSLGKRSLEHVGRRIAARSNAPRQAQVRRRRTRTRLIMRPHLLPRCRPPARQSVSALSAPARHRGPSCRNLRRLRWGPTAGPSYLQT